MLGATSRVMVLPAPTSEFSPMVTPHTMVALAPMLAPRLTSVGTTCQSSAANSSPASPVARGLRSLVKHTWGPIRAPSSIRTPVGMKAKASTLTLLPSTTPRWISPKEAILPLSPMVQPYRLTSSGWGTRTLWPRRTSGDHGAMSVMARLKCARVDRAGGQPPGSAVSRLRRVLWVGIVSRVGCVAYPPAKVGTTPGALDRLVERRIVRLKALPPPSGLLQGGEVSDRSGLRISHDIEFRPAVDPPFAALNSTRLRHLYGKRPDGDLFDNMEGP